MPDTNMQGPLFFALCLLLGLVSCLSSSGSRLLVVVEEAAEKSKYSKYWGDLEGEACWFNTAISVTTLNKFSDTGRVL